MAESVKIIQITDTHLFAADEAKILGVKSNTKFQEVIARVAAEDKHDANILLLTGDISEDETVESYQKVVDHLEKFTLPVHWIPGNHDNVSNMESTFKNAKNFSKLRRLSLPHWDLLFINTKKAGTSSGYLTDDELAILKNEIANTPVTKKISIVMHHHPAPVGTPLIDNYILKNRNAFWDVVDKTQVALIICGHVHGDYQFEHNGVMIESSPATCLQWQKGTTDLQIDTKIGYKIYYFQQGKYQALAKLW